MKSSPDKTVEKILSKFVGCKLPHPKYMTCEWCDELPEAKQSLDSHYLSIFLELVGADEKESCSQNCDGETCCDHEAWIKEGRNALRQELRTALQDRLGGKS